MKFLDAAGLLLFQLWSGLSGLHDLFSPSRRGISIVEHSTYGRIGIRGYFDKVEVGLSCDILCFFDGYHANIVPVGTDEAHLASANV